MEDLARWVARLRTSRPLVDPAMLQWLWTAVTQPVLDELRFRTVAPGAKPPRIIWIPAGPLCHLPIHAAGVHASGSKETVMDRVISSFSPSLKAFLMARRLARRDTRESENLYSGQSALLIGAGEASARPGLGKLPFVAREIEDLTTICKSLNLNPVTLHDPTRAEALAQISECAIMHFAGHGLTDPLEPSQSGLLMDDGILAVSDLLDSRLQSRTPFLAFLSACLTGANDIDDLEDEGVNLTSACQLVGFNHVIGTLWQVSDRTCVEVSQGLYTTLATEGMTSESVCRGLHGAVLRLRDSWVSDGGQTRGGGSVEAVSEEWSDDDDEDEDEGEEDTGEDDEEAKSGVDSGCEPGGDEDEPSQFREAALRLKRRQKPVRNWVRADWIPYIHYGP
ncbi:CHAT domain-containing protein [Podospora conica]|nr:CHAT domain-containing protein [Schizothecium conicum]